MGVASSRIEEDKALQLCQQRKKFVRQALDGRCSLASAHVNYIQSLRSTGIALRKFIEPENVGESSLYTSTIATSEPHALTEKSISQYSLSSPVSQHVSAVETFSPNISPSKNDQFQINHMKSGGSFSMTVEERPPFEVTGTLKPSGNVAEDQFFTPPSVKTHKTSTYEEDHLSPETPPWDYFGLPADNRSSFGDEMGSNHGLEDTDYIGESKVARTPELEMEEKEISFSKRPTSNESEDEFDELVMDNLVRSFENLNRQGTSSSTISPSVQSRREIRTLSGGKTNSPHITPSKGTSQVVRPTIDEKKTPEKEHVSASNLACKDFLLTIKEIESLFLKASECGEEVPRMLEANKFHFRPMFLGKEAGSKASMFLKSCFSCGEGPPHASEEPVPVETKYLTWPKTASSCSSSSRNLLGSTPKGDIEDRKLFSSSYMNSGSHASTLDRLYAWERKLYDEVKASGIIRREYDMKCKLLRQLDSKGKYTPRIDRTRTIVKDLHSRIRVAIHRIDSISKRIEELRDKELQPQLEELIEGLSRMWEMMFECHKMQHNIISTAYHNETKVSTHTESHRQATINLENELHSLSSSFAKWTSAQRSYVKAIDGWLQKCVSLQQKSSRWRKRVPDTPLRYRGPPIFVTCGVWLDKLDVLPAKEVENSIKALMANTTSLLPQHEKSSKKLGEDNEAVKAEAAEDWNSGFDSFKTSLVGFLDLLSFFAESSVKMYGELKKAIEKAKIAYDQSTVKSP